jgi:hypothetical protein
MEGRPLAVWLRVLGQIEEALGKALAQWGEPEALRPPATSAEGGTAARAALQNLDQRLERMRTSLELAGRHAAEVEALLAAESRAVEGWLRSIAARRQRLAGGAGQGTGE